ncbi:MAG: hypothetical protein Q8S84_02675 [bacterium]|nr:hypothetical protein [bacterium]
MLLFKISFSLIFDVFSLFDKNLSSLISIHKLSANQTFISASIAIILFFLSFKYFINNEVNVVFHVPHFHTNAIFIYCINYILIS